MYTSVFIDQYECSGAVCLLYMGIHWTLWNEMINDETYNIYK